MTPTNFFVNAWQKNLETIDPKGKKIEFAIPDHIKIDQGLCCLCGYKIDQKAIPKNKAIKDTFTDNDFLMCPESEHVCLGCGFILMNRTLRNYSYVVTSTALLIASREDLKSSIINPPQPPFMIIVAESKKKHLAYKSEINYQRHDISVLFEETRLYVKPKHFDNLIDIIETLLREFSKTEILSGRFNQSRIIKFGRNAWLAAENKISHLRNTREFNLAVYLAKAPEKEE